MSWVLVARVDGIASLRACPLSRDWEDAYYPRYNTYLGIVRRRQDRDGRYVSHTCTTHHSDAKNEKER